MTPSKSFPVFDADSHVVEPSDIWERYLDPEFRTLGRQALWREHGQHDAYLKVNGKMFRDSMNPNIPSALYLTAHGNRKTTSTSNRMKSIATT